MISLYAYACRSCHVMRLSREGQGVAAGEPVGSRQGEGTEEEKSAGPSAVQRSCPETAHGATAYLLSFVVVARVISPAVRGQSGMTAEA